MRRSFLLIVVALHQRGAQAAAGGVERHARPGDPAADDEDVEALLAQARQRRGALEAIGGPAGHPARLPAGNQTPAAAFPHPQRRPPGEEHGAEVRPGAERRTQLEFTLHLHLEGRQVDR